MSKPIYEKNTRLGYKLEIERLKDIIKEAREYIEKNAITNISWLGTKATKKELFKDNASLYELLQILDKVGEE